VPILWFWSCSTGLSFVLPVDLRKREVGGIALMILPSLIVGNELLILGGVGAAAGVWFFAHRHGQLRGLVDAGEK